METTTVDVHPMLGSAEAWRDKLRLELQKRRTKVDRLERYYDGCHPLPDPPARLKGQALEEARRAYANLMRLGVTNWVKLVADAPSERLEVVGFRFGDPAVAQSASGALSADQRAWRIWQANHLDADSQLVHDNAFQTGQSFVLVDPFVEAGGIPVITAEHSAQVIVAYRPGSRREMVAALKWWQDEEQNLEFETLYLPGEIFKWTLLPPKRKNSTVRERVQRMGDDDSEWPLPNPLGLVPVVEFPANPKLRAAVYGGGTGEFETVLSIQDRINKTIFDRLVTAEFQAFRQRWAIGWTPEFDEETGAPKNPAEVQAAWQALLMTFEGDPDEVKVGEFGQADFKQFLEAVESDVNAMAAISKTPPHYLLGSMVNISGDALTAAESGMTSKTKKHARNFGECWEKVMRLALAAAGDVELAGDMQSQVVWADIEHRTYGQQVDAISKMGAEPIGVPREALWERLPDTTPQDVIRWRAMKAAEGLLRDPVKPEAEPDDAVGTPTS